ncbi:MAG TPA: mandelate racemase/muconate lactonizing enzyme family protein [Chloroflexota bacterium]
MKIEKLETVWLDAHPHTLWLRIHTDQGLVGLGETYYAPRAVSAIIHDVLANLLIGQSVFDIERLWANMFATVNFFGFAGAEMRAMSAVDIALWDLLGQYTSQPIYNLLGGRVRDRVLVYNTCSNGGSFPDYDAWQTDAGALAEDLLRNGIRAMKIWPFDRLAAQITGLPDRRVSIQAAGPLAHYLSPETLREGLKPIEQIRRAVGDQVEIAIEGHARWDLPSALRIAEALAPYTPMWLEEIMPPDNIDAYARLTQESPVPICASERLFTRYGFRELIERRGTHIVMPDIVWTGGITEARKIAILADTHYLPITTHDTVGPVALWAGAHLALYAPNTMIVETVRGYYQGWYNEMMTEPITVRDGHLELAERPGLGTALRDEVLRRPDAHIELSPPREVGEEVSDVR